MRFVITGGGTGGHVYPALAVVEVLAREEQDKGMSRSELLYVGMAQGIEAGLATRTGLPFAAVRAGAIRGGSPIRIVAGAAKLLLGIVRAWQVLRRFRPKAVLSTGGYVSVPVGLAAWLLRVPLVVYLPDVAPGWAVRLLARFARRVAVTSEASRAYLPPAKVVVTGYPVRAVFGSASKEEAQRKMGLDPVLPTLLLWGGSRGARSLNRALGVVLAEVLDLCQVLHVCGTEDEAEFQARREALPAELRERYHVHAYLYDDLPLAMVAADLAVSRAGASIMGEFPVAGLPSILVPYPYAGGHQWLNAKALVDGGAAEIIEDADLEARLLPAVRDLICDQERLAGMAAACRRLARPDAAREIARLLLQAGASR
ncbi:MAG: undecaprenyldiphospho-muramoylpentapeptide beta-N-acetylglucosaminyltransferase [Chloroflexi bacterium]|nr:undecaprenyldiphospho-muramoylpentapeptide beta-N-acetylglucosaminyltransferase [Chloroflexota bacterium]